MPDAQLLPLSAVPVAASRARRVTSGYAALTLPAWLILFDTVVTLGRGGLLKTRLDRAAVAVAAAYLAGVTLLLVFRWGRGVFERHCAQLIVLSASVCVSLVVADFLVGPVLDRVSVPVHGQRPGWTARFRPQPGIIRGVGPEARLSFNSWGVRGSEPPPRDQAYRILCLGGSTTGCTFLDDPKTWPALLETNLNAADSAHPVWVGNTGWPGYACLEHLLFVERSPRMDDIDCLLVQCGINDFMRCLAGPRPPTPIWTRSNLWRLASTLLRSQVMGDETIEDSAGAGYERRRQLRAAAEVADRAPSLDACLSEFSRQLEAMIEGCRRHGVRIVFTTQPTLWRDDLSAEDQALLWFGQMRDGRYLSIAQLRAGIGRYNDVIRAACDKHGVELIDLGALDGESSVFYDDCHLTEVGAERAARIIADWFASRPAQPAREKAP